MWLKKTFDRKYLQLHEIQVRNYANVFNNLIKNILHIICISDLKIKYFFTFSIVFVY